MERELDRLGVIQLSLSPWVSPVVLVEKENDKSFKGGTNVTRMAQQSKPT